jgi:cell division transport system permease protein
MIEPRPPGAETPGTETFRDEASRALAYLERMFEKSMARRAARPRTSTMLLPARSIAGRALVVVIVIMTFLAALTTGGVHLVVDASHDWSQDIAREVTIQIRPMPGRSIDADLNLAVELAKSVRNLQDVRVFDKKEAEKLLEPWLGSGLDLSELPVPRLVVMKFGWGGLPDLAALKAALTERLPNASLDDHRLWLAHLALMADSLIAIGISVLILVLIATGLAVVFATRGAMAGTSHIIEVLHMVGAEDRFIAREFQRHFLLLGFKGGLIGGVLAMAFYALAGIVSGRFSANPGAEQIEALFGRFSLPLAGYASLLAIGMLVAGITAVVSRLTVYRNLGGYD